LAKFQGTWILVSTERNGQTTSEENNPYKLTFTGDKWKVHRGNDIAVEGTVRLVDVASTPKKFDLIKPPRLAPETTVDFGIYEWKGDTLRYCTRNGPLDAGIIVHDPRPRDFTTRDGDGQTVYIWKRDQKEEKNQVQETLTAWGKEVRGLQAGLGFRPGEQRAYRTGETVWLVVRVRNVGKKAVKFSYFNEFFYENPPKVTDSEGKPVPLEGSGLQGLARLVEVTLAPGKEANLCEMNLKLRPASERGKERPVWALFGTGKFQLQHENVGGGNIGTGEIRFDPVLNRLATGKLELEIKADSPQASEKKEEDKYAEKERQKLLPRGPYTTAQIGPDVTPKKEILPEPQAPVEKPAWGKTLNGLRLGLYQIDPKDDGTPRLVVVLENVSSEDLVLILGQSWAGGKKHQLGAIGINLTYTDDMLKRPRALISKGSKRDDLADGPIISPLIVQLVAGGRYMISSDLNDYYDPKNVDTVLAPGNYRVAAKFVGQTYQSGWKSKTDTGPRTYLDHMTYWTGTIESEVIQVTLPEKSAK
jgi:uncharacterized protein (TIGR03067 family)